MGRLIFLVEDIYGCGLFCTTKGARRKNISAGAKWRGSIDKFDVVDFARKNKTVREVLEHHFQASDPASQTLHCHFFPACLLPHISYFMCK